MLVLFVLYIYYQSSTLASTVLGIVLFFTIAVTVALELVNGVNEEGYVKNILEIGAAVLIIIVLWYALRIALNTNYPLDVVPSCSMLPTLQRGDMVVLRGVESAGSLNAPIVEITPSQFAAMSSNITSVQLACVAYKETADGIVISQLMRPGYNLGLYQKVGASGRIVPEEYQHGLISYTCGVMPVRLQNGTVVHEAYTNATTIAGKTITGDMGNSVIVYKTIPSDLFYQQGDAYVIHRVYAILNVSGSYYILTKGDNNPGLDIQYYNYPVSMGDVQGSVVTAIPYLGYAKLILSSSFSQPAGCNSTVLH